MKKKTMHVFLLAVFFLLNMMAITAMAASDVPPAPPPPQWGTPTKASPSVAPTTSPAPATPQRRYSAPPTTTPTVTAESYTEDDYVFLSETEALDVSVAVNGDASLFDNFKAGVALGTRALQKQGEVSFYVTLRLWLKAQKISPKVLEKAKDSDLIFLALQHIAYKLILGERVTYPGSLNPSRPSNGSGGGLQPVNNPEELKKAKNDLEELRKNFSDNDEMTDEQQKIEDARIKRAKEDREKELAEIRRLRKAQEQHPEIEDMLNQRK